MGNKRICKYLRKWLLVSISLNQFAVIFLPLPTYDGQLQLNATDLFSLDGSEKKLYLHVNWCMHPMMVKEAAGSADLKCREVTQKIGTGIAIMHSAGLNISEKILTSLGMLSIFFFSMLLLNSSIHYIPVFFMDLHGVCFHTQISHE